MQLVCPWQTPGRSLTTPVRTLTDCHVFRLGRAPREEYFLSDREAVTAGESSAISPAWLRAKKLQLQRMADLLPDWDSYGARTPTKTALREADLVLLWLALGDVPPPDVFPTIDGGVQIEWHIHGLNAEIEIAPEENDATAYFHDLRTGETWQRSLSSSQLELRTIRARLLQKNGERL